MWSTILTVIMLLIAGLTEVAASVDNLSNGRDVSEYVADQIAHNDIMVFAKTYCPYCREAKFTFQSLLKKLGLDDGKELTYKVIELDEQPDDDGSMIQNELYEITGQHTVPNIFIKGMHIGGNSDVQDLMRDEQLASMIQYN